MSGSVATRLDNEEFWNQLNRLKEEHGIEGKNLVSFMSNSVATRLDNEEFWNQLNRLKEEHGIEGLINYLPKFKKNITKIKKYYKNKNI